MTASLFPFVRNRFRHELLAQHGDVCLVARTNLLTNSVHWEVVRLIHEPEKRYPGGRIVPAHSRYPGDEEWGTAGWTYTTCPEAEQKYRSLAQHEPQKGGSEGGGRATG